jgi:hypothetical protein
MRLLKILLAALLLSSQALTQSKAEGATGAYFHILTQRSGHIEVNARVGNQLLGNR